jgi:predicted dinucleotide-binding enzyme
MKIGIIGSGIVGQTIGAKLVERGEDVVLGTRSPDNLEDKRGMGSPLKLLLNTTNAEVMVDPGKVGGGDHDLFVSGNDAAAKARVTELLSRWFGWRRVIDVGDITTARGTEMLLPIWVRLYGALGTPYFNFKIVR